MLRAEESLRQKVCSKNGSDVAAFKHFYKIIFFLILQATLNNTLKYSYSTIFPSILKKFILWALTVADSLDISP